jgi:hypothetical protein
MIYDLQQQLIWESLFIVSFRIVFEFTSNLIYYCGSRLMLSRLMVLLSYCSHFTDPICVKLQWKPLHVITLGQRESDNINLMITISNCILIKQWQLASEFCECEFCECCEYSREYSRTHAFLVDVVTRQTRQHSPSRVARTRQTRRHLPSWVARTRQTRQHSPKAISKKNVTRLNKFARVTHESREFGASGHSSQSGTTNPLCVYIQNFTYEQWKPLNVITVNVISCLLWSDLVVTISAYYVINKSNPVLLSFGYCYQFSLVTKWSH